MKTLTLILCLSVNLMAQTHTCTMGAVEWNDAVSYDNTMNLEEAPFVKRVSFGCVDVRKDRIIVIHEFNQGVPSMFTLIPRGWDVKILYAGKGVKHEIPQGLGLAFAAPSRRAPSASRKQRVRRGDHLRLPGDHRR